jgi:tRNA-specific 2-thiouridylase
MKIAIGLSGGVDSSVAALLLKRAGHDVTGVMMALWPSGQAAAVKRSGCYGPNEAEDIRVAREVCQIIGIPFFLFDCSAGYEDMVLRYFRDEYRSGRTPNPCVRCNEKVKFGLLPCAARDAGLLFDRFATGHYARIERDPQSGRYLLKKARDERKDQSYFLYRLSQDQLRGALFPLGELAKDDVRRIARESGLPVYDRKESQDFYGGDLKDILRQDDKPGDIVNGQGTVLGSHRGVWNYTVGQRKGLGIASGTRLYVTAVDAERNRLIVGPEHEARRRSCLVTRCNWIACETLEVPTAALVKIRSSGIPLPAGLTPLDDRSVLINFAKPVAAVTPGQSAVFYRDDLVLGGGNIQRAE